MAPYYPPLPTNTWFQSPRSPAAPIFTAQTLVGLAQNPTGDAATGVALAHQFLQTATDLRLQQVMSDARPITANTVVDKHIESGERKGAFYYNGRVDPKTGKPRRIYLKKKQRQECTSGSLPGALNECPAIVGYKRRKVTDAQQAALAVLSFGQDNTDAAATQGAAMEVEPTVTQPTVRQRSAPRGATPFDIYSHMV